MNKILSLILFSFLLSQDCEDGYTYIPASEISLSTTSLPFELGQPYTCFNNGDLEFLNDLNTLSKFIK